MDAILGADGHTLSYVYKYIYSRSSQLIMQSLAPITDICTRCFVYV